MRSSDVPFSSRVPVAGLAAMFQQARARCKRKRAQCRMRKIRKTRRTQAMQPVACGALRPFNDTTAEVRRMYVRREHRRQGLARAVLSHLEAEARRLGYSKLVLETGCKQIPAMRLWEAPGFQHIPPFGAYANDLTSVCYELRIS